jgi:Ca-activated chloride channel family protein
VAFLSLTGSGCDRKHNPLFSTPTTGVSSLNMSIVQIDASQAPNNRAFLSVRDGANSPLTDFKLGNFSLLENGRPGVPHEVGRVDDPFSLVLVIDRSGSMSGSNEIAANNAASALVNTLGATDRMAIVEFASTINFSISFTSNKSTLLSVLTTNRSNGGTALYDATAAGAKLLNTAPGRRLYIVLTDGVDTASLGTITDAIDAVNKAGIRAYMVGLGSGVPAEVLNQISSATNGQTYLSANGSDLTNIFLNIFATMQNLVYVAHRKRDEGGTLTVYLNYGDLTASATRPY